jgi:hypothetical protein
MYLPDGSVTSKGWGMFSSLGSDSAAKQRLRPWYHSSVLLTNLMRRGGKIIDSGVNIPELDKSFRSMGVIGPNNEFAGVVAINRDVRAAEKTFRIDEDFTDSNKIYVYIYNENQLVIGDDGFVKPNSVVEGSLKNIIKINVPANSMVILSSKEL